MHALLVVNPKATTTSALVSDVLVRALSSDLDLQVTVTKDRGHATELGAQARADALDLVIVYGGDGTVNEVVNGMLAAGPGPRIPDLAVIPGGSTNVFAKALGLSPDRIEATGQVLAALRDETRREVSLGRAGDRWFTFCAGMGFDAEIVGLVEQRRAEGARSTHGLYLRSAVHHYFRGAERHVPPLRLERPGHDPVDGLFLAIVANTRPWTYLGQRPILPLPAASFDTGLDLAGVTDLGLLSTLRQATRLLTQRSLHGRRVVDAHDLDTFTLRAEHPVAVQVDGDYLGEHDELTFQVARRALRVVR